ncbi:fucose-specific lectin [Xylaria venustula]|nr:fucose-specific lectin [Xylaria venustula]
MAPARDGSDVATVPTATNECRVYYQDTDGFIREHIHRLEGWTLSNIPPFKAKPASPLAVVGWDNGSQIRLYCVSVEGYLEEWCYGSNQDRWVPGYLSNSKFRVHEASKLAAISWYENGPSIRVYAQDPDNKIQEYINSGPTWTKREVGTAAEFGASLAVVQWKENGIRIRLYHQASDRTIKEYCSDAGGPWSQGAFKTPELPPYTAITALAWPGTGAPLRVYFQDTSNSIVEFKHDQTWSHDSTVIRSLRPGRRLAALQWETGAELRLYYQGDDNRICEVARSEDAEWYPGEFVSH